MRKVSPRGLRKICHDVLEMNLKNVRRGTSFFQISPCEIIVLTPFDRILTPLNIALVIDPTDIFKCPLVAPLPGYKGPYN